MQEPDSAIATERPSKPGRNRPNGSDSSILNDRRFVQLTQTMLRERVRGFDRRTIFAPSALPGIGERGQEAPRGSPRGSRRLRSDGRGGGGRCWRGRGWASLTLIDRDFVEESNLQRQVLFDEADAREALPKAEAARRKIAAFNSETASRRRWRIFSPANIHGMLGGGHSAGRHRQFRNPLSDQ